MTVRTVVGLTGSAAKVVRGRPGRSEQWIKEGKANLVVRVETIDRYDN
jgi:hypothetical protein